MKQKLLQVAATCFFLISMPGCEKEYPDPQVKRHFIDITNSRIAIFNLTQKEFDYLSAPDNNLYKELYLEVKDDFDFILEIYNTSTTPERIPYNGAAYVYSNEVSGIGRTLFNNAADMGSDGKLKAIFSIPRNDALKPNNWNMLCHEILHTWANYGIDTEYFSSPETPASDWAHWGISGAGQILRGFDQATLETNVDGDSLKYRFTPPENPFLTRYSNFELYLMGLIPLEEVTPFNVFKDLISMQDHRTFWAKTKLTFDQKLIVEKLGVRSPAFPDTQKKFKMLVVVFTPSPLYDHEINQFNLMAEQFSRPAADDYEDRINFWEATSGKAILEIDDVLKSKK